MEVKPVKIEITDEMIRETEIAALKLERAKYLRNEIAYLLEMCRPLSEELVRAYNEAIADLSVDNKHKFHCENCEHFYYSKIVQGGSCWYDINDPVKRDSGDEACEYFVPNKDVYGETPAIPVR